MKLIIILGTLAFALATPLEEIKPSFWPVPSERFNGRIIHGEAAEKGAAPFICSLRWGNTGQVMQHVCGGSIIAKDWFMTAAHCLTEVPQTREMDILCGLTERIPNGNEQIREFDRFDESIAFWHSNFRPGSDVGPFDIALIRLVEPFEFNDWVQPIRQLNREVSDGVAQLFGWGANGSGGIPLQLQTAEKDVVTVVTCREMISAVLSVSAGDRVHETNICSVRNNISACGGDSGGPLVVRSNLDGVWAQVGVVSWAISPCGVLDAPSVLTRTSSHIAWIQENTGLALEDFTASE